MELFKGQSLLEFTERFKTDLDCEEYLASIKWEKGYCCRKCGHTKYQVRKDFSRTCNICSDTESPTAGTLFHKLKFGLLKAFYICFEMSTTTKSLSASQVARRYDISRQTAHYFMHKVREAMKSSESQKMDGKVQVDEFTIGGKEEGKQGRSYDAKKKKVLCAIQLSNRGKVKRFYAFKIPDYSSKSLRTIFDKHIDKTAYITTDEWKGYRPIKDYNITQKPSNDGKNFPTLHKVIHQVKSWIRGIYSWVSEFNIDRYLAEYSFRINRSQNKETIFNNLIKRLIERKPIFQSQLVCP